MHCSVMGKDVNMSASANGDHVFADMDVEILFFYPRDGGADNDMVWRFNYINRKLTFIGLPQNVIVIECSMLCHTKERRDMVAYVQST